jgi:hypothetical protein
MIDTRKALAGHRLLHSVPSMRGLYAYQAKIEEAEQAFLETHSHGALPVLKMMIISREIRENYKLRDVFDVANGLWC